MTDQLASHMPVQTLVDAFRQSERDIRRACELLLGAEERLKSLFLGKTYGFDLRGRHHRYVETDAEVLVTNLKREAWSVVVERLEIRKLLSIKRAKELDKQLREGDLPPLTIEAITEFSDFYLTHHGDMLQEAVEEVFNWLRPENSRYKRNSEYEVPRRVVLTWMIDTKYCTPHVHYDKQANLLALDNLFSGLDGKGQIAATYKGPSVDAIDAAKGGLAETEYFEYRACKNGNLHCTFRRADLLAKFNRIAGGKRLRGEAA